MPRSALTLRKIDRFLPKLGQQRVELLADLGRELLLDVEDLLAQLALCARELVLDRPRAPSRTRSTCPAAAATAPWSPSVRASYSVFDALRQRLGLGAGVLLDGREPLADVLGELRRFPRQALFDAGEPLIEIAHLPAEENVADLVETRRAGLVRTCRPRLCLPGT